MEETFITSSELEYDDMVRDQDGVIWHYDHDLSGLARRLVMRRYPEANSQIQCSFVQTTILRSEFDEVGYVKVGVYDEMTHNPPESLPEPSLNTQDGLLDREGKLWPCRYGEHIALEYRLKVYRKIKLGWGKQLQDVGWISLQRGTSYPGNYDDITQAQRNTTFD